MMKKIAKRMISFLLVAAMLLGSMTAVFAEEAGQKADYSVSPDYAARYPNGVFEFTQGEAVIDEGGSLSFKLIREGGTQGKVTIELKAIDVTAKYGVDYYIKADGKKLVLDEEYIGTITENHLLENGVDYIIPDEVTTDEVYKAILGYEEQEIDDETSAEFYDASVGLVADTLGISNEQAGKLLGGNADESENAEEAPQSDAEKAYASSLHEQRDAIMGNKTAANHMDDTDLIDENVLLGSNAQNLAASEIYGNAVGASLVLTFKDGENEKDITVVTLSDKDYEPQEIAALGICNPTGGAEIGGLLNIAVKINNDDPVQKSKIGFETTSVTVGSDENAAAVDIVRTGCLNDYAVVNVATKAGTALEGEDYLPIQTSGIFLPGEEKKTVIVPLKTSCEDQTESKTLDVTLSSDSKSVTVTDSVATVEIEPKLVSAKVVARLGKNPFEQDEEEKKYWSTIPQETIDKWKEICGGDDAEVRLFCDDSHYDWYATEIVVVFNYYNNEYQGWDEGHIEIECTAQENNARYSSSNDREKNKVYSREAFVYWYTLHGESRYKSNEDESMALDYIDLKGQYYDYRVKLWYKQYGSIDSFYPKWKDVNIKEIKIRSRVFESDLNGGLSGQRMYKEDDFTAEHRVFDGTTDNNIIDTTRYNAAHIVVSTESTYIYRNAAITADSVTLTAEAQERGAKLWGYKIVNRDVAEDVVEKRVGEPLTNEDYITLTNDHDRSTTSVKGSKGYYYPRDFNYDLYPILRGDDIDYINISDFGAEKGRVIIGGVEYCGKRVESKSWREGDELKFYVEPMHGYLCNEIKVSYAGGKTVSVKPGDNVRLAKGMTIDPQFVEENITATVKWVDLLPGKEGESKNVNLSHNYTIAATEDFEYAKDANGNEDTSTLIFKNLAHGDTVTLYAAPGDNATERYTGMWRREATEKDNDVLSSDTRFFCCVGDGYSFTVDNHDMVFSYYFVDVGNETNATVVTGSVYAPGGSVKHRNNTELTAENVKVEGVPVVGAAVSVFSTDPMASLYQDGVYYYSDALTDANGRFSVYLPTGAGGYGYCVRIQENKQEYNLVASLVEDGEPVFILPFQSLKYQVTEVTVGTDQDTSEIAVGDNDIVMGFKVTVAEGYRAQGLIIRSYDANDILFKEWSAIDGSNGWDYKSTFVPNDNLVPGGKITVEIVAQDGTKQGEIDTGYRLYRKPAAASFQLPQFDPVESVTLPVFGTYTSTFDLGYDPNAEPQEEAAETSTLSVDYPGKLYSIAFGSAKTLKNAVKSAKENNADYYKLKPDEKAEEILKYINNPDYDSPKAISGKTGVGDGVTGLNFKYEVGVYMSFYDDYGTIYFDDLVIYASGGVSASETFLFSIAGVPVYVTFAGALDLQLLFHVDNKSLDVNGNPKDDYVFDFNGCYLDKDMLKATRAGGAFQMTVSISLETGLGNPKYLSGGVKGKIDVAIDYQPWDEGAGIATLTLSLEVKVIVFTVSYKLAEASYGMFRTKNYSGELDFSNVKNYKKFQKDGVKALRSYDDGETFVQVSGEIVNNRSNSVMSKDSMQPHEGGMQAAYSNVIARKTLEGATDNTDPLLIPINGGNAALYLRLDDNPARGNCDYSTVAYSIIDFDGHETGPFYLDNDGTFDSDLAACEIGDGRVLVVWSNMSKVFGNTVTDYGKTLNYTDLSYCIFEADGTPGEVKKLTDTPCAEKTPTIAYDKTTGKTVVSYLAVDYQTEGVTFGEDNLEDLGNFIYNSYSTVCFKVLDENGDIVTDYAASESNYADYEAANGSLNGMRYLNTQLDANTAQATIDEMSLAARNGKLYAVYSLDMDSSINTDKDRELFVTVVDLATMEQGEPERLTDNAVADINPQIADYNDELQLYWNHDGVIKMVDLEKYAAYRAGDEAEFIKEIATCAKTIETAANAAHSFHVKKFADGRLALVWQGPKTENGVTKNALFYKEYDPQFKNLHHDEDGNVIYTYGSWGNTQTLTVLGENEGCSEFAFLDSGERSMICYNVTNADENGNIASHDAHLLVLGEETTVDVKVDFTPKYSVAGDKTAMKVKIKNTGSLPSEKLTAQIDMVDKNGNVTPIANEVIEEHYQSNGEVTLTYDIDVPENFEDYTIRVVAWENDLEKSAKIERVKFPYDSAISIENVKLTREGTGYALTFDVENEGNKDFDGVVELDYVAETLGIFTENETFTPVVDDIPVSVSAKDFVRKVIIFDVDEDKLSARDGACEIMLTVQNGESKTLDSKTFRVQKNYTKMPEVKSVLFDGSEDVPSLTLNQNDEVSLNALIMPYKARNGYHLVYKSSDPSVATVDSKGNVKALKNGNANITVSAVKDPVAMVVDTKNRSNVSANEYGIVEIAGSEKEVVMTKTVSVSVNGSSAPDTTEYQITEGNGAKWTQGSDQSLSFKSSAGKAKFASIKVDGKTIDAKNYTVAEDGTVTLKASFLKALAAGSHTLTIVSTDGEATAQFTVGEAEKPTQPSTGEGEKPTQPTDSEDDEQQPTRTQPVEYAIDKGDGEKWTKDSEEGLSFKSNADKDKFVAVKVDGETVSAENYTIEDDGTVTLKPSFLETLAPGDHTLTIVSEDGEATTHFTVKEAASGEDITSQKSDDSTNLYLWISLAVVLLGGIAAVIFFVRKRKNR